MVSRTAGEKKRTVNGGDYGLCPGRRNASSLRQRDARRHGTVSGCILVQLHRKPPEIFRKAPGARAFQMRFTLRMYCTDSVTGETEFALPALHAAREVFLECFIGRNHFRVPMRRQASRWVVRLTLAPGLLFYRIEVDGKARRDRNRSRLKTQDGQPCSLAVIVRASLNRFSSPPPKRAGS